MPSGRTEAVEFVGLRSRSDQVRLAVSFVVSGAPAFLPKCPLCFFSLLGLAGIGHMHAVPAVVASALAGLSPLWCVRLSWRSRCWLALLLAAAGYVLILVEIWTHANGAVLWSGIALLFTGSVVAEKAARKVRVIPQCGCVVPASLHSA